MVSRLEISESTLTTSLQTGTRQELGIIPCAVDGVFDAINNVRRFATRLTGTDELQEPDRAFLLRVSYVEVRTSPARLWHANRTDIQRDNPGPSQL
jgi:centromeric protein E